MKFKDLKPGEVLSETSYYRVVKSKGNQVQLETDKGEMIVVDDKIVESSMNSAVQFSKIENINRTDAAAKFVASTGVAITVNFNKQVKEADVVKEIMDTYSSSTPKEFETKVKKAIKSGLTGIERTIVGRHYGNLTELGRVNFVDMEEAKVPGKDYDSRMRQVDPRTINYFICRGVKYVVK